MASFCITHLVEILESCNVHVFPTILPTLRQNKRIGTRLTTNRDRCGFYLRTMREIFISITVWYFNKNGSIDVDVVLGN